MIAMSLCNITFIALPPEQKTQPVEDRWFHLGLTIVTGYALLASHCFCPSLSWCTDHHRSVGGRGMLKRDKSFTFIRSSWAVHRWVNHGRLQSWRRAVKSFAWSSWGDQFLAPLDKWFLKCFCKGYYNNKKRVLCEYIDKGVCFLPFVFIAV